MKGKKEIQKRLLVRRTLTDMNKHINALEEQKKKYIESAKTASQKGLTAQVNLAISGLKNVMVQQRRAQEMLLNFEITSNMKDMAEMTSGFLKGMSVLSKEMAALTKEKEFIRVQGQFEKAITAMETRTEQMDAFLDMNQGVFENQSAGGGRISDDEIRGLIDEQASGEDAESDAIDKELAELRKKLDI